MRRSSTNRWIGWSEGKADSAFLDWTQSHHAESHGGVRHRLVGSEHHAPLGLVAATNEKGGAIGHSHARQHGDGQFGVLIQGWNPGRSRQRQERRGTTVSNLVDRAECDGMTDTTNCILQGLAAPSGGALQAGHVHSCRLCLAGNRQPGQEKAGKNHRAETNACAHKIRHPHHHRPHPFLYCRACFSIPVNGPALRNPRRISETVEGTASPIRAKIEGRSRGGT